MVHLTLVVILRPLTLICIFSLIVAADINSGSSRHIRLDCGASTPHAIDFDGRTWDSDRGSKFAPALNGTAATAASYQNSALHFSVPYMNARIFVSNYTYSFSVNPGRMFVRLYFNPSTYGNYSPVNAYFGVTDGNLTLLDSFNASQYALTINTAFFFLEYSVSVTSGRLELTFAPSTHQNGSYAFINGTEIVPTPDDLFTVATPTLTDGEKRDPFPIDPAWGFQTMYRLNVGGDDISPRYDVDFYRSWRDDSPYIYGPGYGKTFEKDGNVTITYTPSAPKYSAPIEVYATARTMGADAQVNLKSNLTWTFLVDAGFYYILRFHFCEIQYLITKINQRSFSIYINNLTALHQIDVIALSLGIGRPVYLDYAILTTGSGQMDLWIALQPDLSSSPEYYDAILNGLEIFKVQIYGENSLAMHMAPLPPSPDEDPNGLSGRRRQKRAAPAVIRGAIGSLPALVCA